MNICDVCTGCFRTKSAARDHKKATGHCVCKHCSKILDAKKDLEEHINALHKYKCPQCATTFKDKVLLKHHQKGRKHCYCGECDRAFGTLSEMTTHLHNSRHPAGFHCCDCDRDFINSEALEQHLHDKVHKRPAVARSPPKVVTLPRKQVQNSAKITELPHPCTICPRRFKTPTCLKKHLKSLAHSPLSNLQCIGGASCKKRFPSPSALLHHLESGACSSGTDYEMVKKMVIHHDTENLVTRGQGRIHEMLEEVSNKLRSRLPHQAAAADSESEVSVPTPSSSLSQVCRTPEDGSVKEWAVAVSQSSHRRCPFCNPSRRPFPTQQALQDHLQSVAHCKPFVFCPVSLTDGKSGTSKVIRAFTTVSGLVQHLESGACYDGIAGFWKTAKYLEKRLQMWGLNCTLMIKSKGKSQ